MAPRESNLIERLGEMERLIAEIAYRASVGLSGGSRSCSNGTERVSLRRLP
jgi:hypothetical protein